MKRYLSIVAIGLLAGCSTAYQERSATQGTVVGAAAGAVIGSQSDQIVEGAIIGGVLGGLVGAMLADDRDDRIHESAPRYHRSSCSRGDIYFERASHERGLYNRITLMRQGIVYCPSNPAAHNDLGVALMLWGDNNAARIHFQQALRFDPQYYPARHNMARMSHYQAPARYRQQRPVARPAARPAPREQMEQRRENQEHMRDRRENNYRQNSPAAERNNGRAQPQQNRDRQNKNYRQDEEDNDRNRQSRDRRDD